MIPTFSQDESPVALNGELAAQNAPRLCALCRALPLRPEMSRRWSICGIKKFSTPSTRASFELIASRAFDSGMASQGAHESQ
jgi:hypothetical protein